MPQAGSGHSSNCFINPQRITNLISIILSWTLVYKHFKEYVNQLANQPVKHEHNKRELSRIEYKT